MINGEQVGFPGLRIDKNDSITIMKFIDSKRKKCDKKPGSVIG